MAILDLQALEAPESERNGHGHDSTLSVLSCVSAASITLCL
jgi:Lanthionine-containing peptide SapB precursor RamS